MTHFVYIDYPDSPGSYDFRTGEHYSDDVVSRKIGTKAKFVCNACAKISKGDIYELWFDDPADATVFVLKCEYELIDKSTIEKYRSIDKKRDLQGSLYF
jgi:hypothetical protein